MKGNGGMIMLLFYLLTVIGFLLGITLCLGLLNIFIFIKELIDVIHFLNGSFICLLLIIVFYQHLLLTDFVHM